MVKQCKQWQILFSYAPRSQDGDCSHSIKRCLLFGRKAMTNLEYVSKFEKLSRGHRTEKSWYSSQFPRSRVPKNAQTTRQLHSFPMLVRLYSKSPKLGFSTTWTENLQMFKQEQAGDQVGEQLGDQVANIHWIKEKARQFQKNIYLFYWLC